MQKLNVKQNNSNVIKAFQVALETGHRNLLDNPWFTVNQRGASGTISTANQFGADRWKKSGGSGRVIVGDGYFTPVGGGGYRQINPWNKIISGRTYTVSAMTADGNVYSATGVLSSTTSGWQISSHLIPNSLWVGVQNNGGNLDIIFTGQNGDIQVIAVKLELGSVSTLANDAPPDYGEELSKCQRYFLRIYGDPIGTGYIASGLGTVFILVPTGVTMRAKPTVSYSGAFSVRVQGSTISVSAMTFATPAHTGGGVGIVCTLSSNAGPVGACAMYPNATTSYIDLSADL